MKHLLSLLLLLTLSVNAQKNDCIYDIEEKTDSTSLRVLPNVLMHEKIFGNTNEYLFFALLNSVNNFGIASVNPFTPKQRTTNSLSLSSDK